MGSIRILLGRSRWRRRRALPAEALSGVDGWGRPTFLYLTGTTRKRRTVEQDFVDHRRGELCFAPSVRVLGEFLADLWLRHGDGDAALSPRVEARVAERLVAAQGAAWPWLSSLGGGPLVGEALAELRHLLASARRTSVGDVPHAAELQAAITALTAALGRISGHVSRTTAHERLIRRLSSPTRALVQQLRAHHSVVIDDVLQPSPLERALLLELCRAFRDAGTHVVLSFETGRDLGGAEAGLFFEYDDVDGVAYALRPFRATRALRRAVFEELVATGEADISLALRDRVIDVAPGAVVAEAAEPDLSDHVYGPRPIPVHTPEAARALLRDTLRIRRHPDSAAEARSIARGVKRALLDGAAPPECVVAVPDLGAAGALLSALADHGVPATPSRRASLATTPMATVTRNVATLALRGFPVDQVLALLRSDLVSLAEPGATIDRAHAAIDRADIDRLAQWCAAAGVPDGPPGSWRPTLDRWLARARRIDPGAREALEALLGRCDAVVRPLERLARPAEPAAWRDTLLRELNRLDVPVRAGSPNPAGPTIDDGPVASDNLDAWGAILQALDELVRDLTVAGDRQLFAEDLAAQLERALTQTPRRAQRRGGGGVEVVEIGELLGLSPRRLWLGGLTAAAFPRPSARSFLVPATELRRLEPRDPNAEARYVFSSILRNALDDREMVHLEISWPATVGGRATAPSPLLEDLLALPTQVTNAEGEHQLLADLVVDGTDAAHLPPLGQADALRLAAHHAAWRAVDPANDELVSLQAQVHAARTAPTPGPWEGVLERPPHDPPDTIAVTTLETYLKCPARHWYRSVLRLDVPEPWAPDVEPHRRGSVLHRILEVFLTERLGGPLLKPAAPLAAALHQVAVRELDALAAEGGFAQALLDQHRDEWLAGLIDDRPAGVLCAWLDDELAAEGRFTPIEVERRHELPVGPIRLSAQLDRLDKVRNKWVVVDYKSGRPPSPARVERGLALQPVAYAAIVARERGDSGIASTYVDLGRPDRVRRTGWVGDPATLDYAGAPKRGRLDLSAEARQALLDHAGQAAARLQRGLAHTTLAEPDEAGCSWCEYRRICRVSPDRSSQLLLSEADLQRPIPTGTPADDAAPAPGEDA